VEYTVSELNKWLHQHQFSYKQPKGIPHKFDVDKQAAFIEYYEQLKNNLSENEPLLFMDAPAAARDSILSAQSDWDI
jgi:hypothetical protein